MNVAGLPTSFGFGSRCGETRIAAELVGFGRRHEVRALPREFALHFVGDRGLDDDRVGRRAEDAVVERLADDDVARRLGEIGRALDEARRVAGPDAVGGLAGAVGRTHQAHPASGQNHRDVAVLHQFLRAFERDGLHPVDRAFRRAGLARGVGHHFGDARDAARGRRVRADHDRAARFERDQDLVDRRRRRVRGRDDRGDHPEGLGNLDDLALLVARDDADRAHRTDERVDLLGREEVLLNLVGDDAVGRFFDRKPRELLGARARRRGHRVDDAVDLFLAEFRERGRRRFGALRELPGFLNGREIAIGRSGHWRRTYDALAPLFGSTRSTSAWGRGMTCTETSSPTRRAAAAPASVAAFTAPTSPRASTVT